MAKGKESVENVNHAVSPERRRALGKIAVGVGTLAGYSVLPERWTRPVVGHVVLPAHAETSGAAAPDAETPRPTLYDPCTVELLWRADGLLIIQVEGYLTPPTSNVNVTIVAEFENGSGNTVATTATDATGSFSEILSLPLSKGTVMVTTSAAGADGVGHCSVSPSANPIGTPAP